MQLADLCRDCGGKCCADPFLTPEEYVRLEKAVGVRKIRKKKPFPVFHEKQCVGWRFKLKECPGLSKTGCVLSYQNRPQVCRLYPYFIIPDMDGKNTLALLLRVCPHWKEFGDHYDEIAKEAGIEPKTIDHSKGKERDSE